MSKRDKEIPANITKKGLGIRLLNSVRDKKYKEATILLEHEPDMTVKDGAGWQALHFAALDGNVEMMEMLLASGAAVECWDNNGQSPLHKATSRGHLEAVVSLVAHGAAFPYDWKGRTPLELAVIEKYVDIVQVLCSFGAYVPPKDWNYLKVDSTPKVQQIKAILKIQRSLLADFEYRKIFWKVQKIEKAETEMSELDLTVFTKDYNKPFYLYIAQKRNFAEFINILRDEQNLFSDLYECRIWRAAEKSVNLKIKIDSIPGPFHDLIIMSQEPGFAKISSFNVENKVQSFYFAFGLWFGYNTQWQTTVTVSLNLRKMKTVNFALLLKEKEPEVFQISEKSMTIRSETEPEAEISIPEGTFEKSGQLQIEFTESKYVNEEEIEGPILLTNVLGVTITEGSTMATGKEVTMKLPILKRNEGIDEDIVVLVSSEEFPDSVDDWEILEADYTGHKRSAVFNVSHFSVFVGASKEKVRKSKEEVVDAAQRCLGDQVKVVFVGYAKLEDDRIMTVAIECSTPKKAKKREKELTKKGFKQLFPKTDPFVISKTEIFRFEFQLGSNLRDPTGVSVSNLSFQSTKNSNLIKELHIIDKNDGIGGEVKVDLEERSEVGVNVVSDKGCSCYNKQQNNIKTVTNIAYKDVTKLQFNVPQAALNNFSCSEEPKVEPSEIQKSSMPDVWWYSSLKELASMLSDEEAEHMAMQLNLKRGDVEKLQNSENKQEGMALLVFKHWKNSTHSLARIKQLQSALIAIGRQALAIAFRKAHLDNTPFKKENVETDTEVLE